MAKNFFEEGKEAANFEVDFLPSDIPATDTEAEKEAQARAEKKAIEFMERVAPKFTIKRKQKELIDKTKPLFKLENAFIQEQKARRNSPYTIKHYEQSLKAISAFKKLGHEERCSNETCPFYEECRHIGFITDKVRQCRTTYL